MKIPINRIIESSWKEDDNGYWAILKPGWTVDGSTGVHEDTKIALYKRIRECATYAPICAKFEKEK